MSVVAVIVVVSDAGPLISLARLDLLTLLLSLFAEVQVPHYVIDDAWPGQATLTRPASATRLGEVGCAHAWPVN